ncbi:MAG TPA: beta-propeller domain-containing protein [Longimicrobium sp.]|nr:beta-propeller domain-containing protein [Longimicrobium sp.]
MRLPLLAPAAAALIGLAACASHRPGPQDPPRATLRAFQSEAEFIRFHRRLAHDYKRAQMKQEIPLAAPPPPPAPPPPAPPPPPSAGAPAAEAPAPVQAFYSDAAARSGAESITNVQHAGVDEGGIVKVAGDYLVILRRGRLFTVRVGGNALDPISAVDAFAPGVDPGGSWYDELLVSGDLVVVIGYSYSRGGTEVGLFRLDREGRLSYRSTYHLRSSDYYSSRNYASRLVDGKLVFYAPIGVDPEARDPFASFPRYRRWGAGDTTWQRTATPTRVYRAAGRMRADDELMLHTVTVCDPSGDELECRATSLYGPTGRVFYVSPGAVYVWATQWARYDDKEGTPPRSVLYRMPLDGSAPTGLRVLGGPVDQFSFLESPDRHLNVLVRSDAGGEGMWGSEYTRGGVRLLRVPLAAFGDASRHAPLERYRPLPQPQGYPLQNRYVGDWLLYGVGNTWGRPREGGNPVYAVRWAGAGPAVELRLPHGVDRIEQMGSGAVVIGSDGADLHFSGVRLGAAASLAERYTRENASQGETRSHGFFYRPDAEESGLLGLPIVGGARPGYAQLRHGSASILFLRNTSFRFQELGDLAAGAETGDDGCRASCVDWYGNARPIFLRGRIFALLGYELVEGAEGGGRIREVRRTSFAPTRIVAGQ